MAPPRASRLASRKSHAQDKDLYDSPITNQDSDLSSNTLFNKKSLNSTRSIPSTSTSNSNSINKDTTSRRRSSRLSTESASSLNDSPAPILVIAKHRAPSRDKPVPKATTTKTTKGNSKKGKEVKSNTIVPKSRSRIEREEEDQGVEEEDENEGDEEDLIIPSNKANSTEGKDRNKKIKLDSEAGTSGSRFVPRAAEMMGKPAKAQPKYDHVLSDGEDVGFAFTTNPPTPAPPARKRAAPQVKENPRQKNSRTTTNPNLFQDEDASPSQPIPSTSRLLSPYSPARGSNHMAPIYTAETPKQMRNLALRGQDGKGTPGSAGRRGSVDRNRGKRASQIGNGQEALPHPDVKTDTLFRLLDPLDPYTHRMRSLIRWTAHRQRDSLFPPTIKSSNLSKDQAFAKLVMDDFITAISDKTIRVNAEPPRDSRAGSTPHTTLAPHQGNGKNRELLQYLKEDFDEIEKEDTIRQAVVINYDKFLIDHENTLSRAASKGPLINVMDISTEDMSYPGPKSLEEALALGKALLAGEGDYKKGNRKLGIVLSNTGASASSNKKGKGKEIVGVTSTDSTEEELLKEQLNAIPLQSAHFKLLTHRLSTFTTLSSTYVQTRIQQTHQALTETSQQGLISTTNVTSSNNPTGISNDEIDYRSGIAQVVQGFSGMRSTTGRVPVVNQSMDMRDLLRAIASADSKRK